jgi:hypothetical protein
LREVGRHFSYYAGMARTYGMVFAPQLAIFDLGYVTRRAFERASPAGADLLREMLSLPHRTGADVHSMAVKAKLILGGFFVENRLETEAELVRRNLADVDRVEIERAETELLAADRSFFEVTDRQLNLEFVPPERREPLRRFCSSLQHAPGGAAPGLPRESDAAGGAAAGLPRESDAAGGAAAGLPRESELPVGAGVPRESRTG